MARISAADAQIAARKIAEPIQQKAIKVMNELSEYITELWKAKIPVEVMRIYEKQPNYIRTTSYVNITGTGFAEDRSVNLIGQWPCDINDYRTEFHLTSKEAVKANKLADQEDDLRKKYKDTEKEIEVTILNLGTHKQVLENMPEAYEYLPGMKDNAQLMVQLAPTREKVRCLVSPEKEKKCMKAIINN